MKKIIEIKNLDVNFNNTPILSDINLTVMEKDFLGIIGPNGGGKTTLLKCILGFIEYQQGEIFISGKSLKQSKKIIGYVPQFLKFNKGFPITAKEIVLMGKLPKTSIFFSKPSNKDLELATDLMNKLEILNLQNLQISQLSGGQLQRVLIARSLAINPDILLLDEPTASVDATSRTNIFDILKKLNKEMTIVVVTHDTGFISTHIKTVACLNKKLHYHGDPVLSDEIISKTYGCPVDLIAHGVPHRVFKEHKETNND